ncbi:hypothetical protein IDJ75_16325 [Mucilaginibacter rigui]|uniref:Lipoprotein n=1 Tax=Mucilaginibacter rigui TaxID=534635 RepID=A0ABR7XAJ1_9SPHI|nr:hypothetical protein [Mucilaginibacter rigui]MBD1386852.1 hypothetical protein [Mucilaginibacter rigui]
MKIKLPIICIFISSVLIFDSCKKDYKGEAKVNVSSTLSLEQESQKTFSKILSKAIQSSEPLRKFLKTESLKQFDNDYDILYQLVRNEKVSDNKTFHEIMASYANSEKQLDSLESKLPLLTIFVPTLPNFNPQQWNITNEIPLVANSLVGVNNVELFDGSGKEEVIKPGEIPGFPVVVVKQNERVVLNKGNDISKRNTTNSIKSSSNNNLAFSFSDEAFNGLKNVNSKDGDIKMNRIATTGEIDPVNIAAYNSGDSWQRDYVYYGLTATNTKGEFKNNYSEFITSMKFLTPDALGMIADQDGDPKANQNYGHGGTINGQPIPPTMWTEGNFEFRITVLINSKNGLGNDITKVLSVKPTDLFDLQYDKVVDNKPFNLLVYHLKTITPKEYHPNVELVPWDLQNYGTAWKFIVYEYDNSQEITQSYENTTTFAANFEITNAVTQKVGLKFGSSATTSEKRTFNVKTTLTSDFLGEATLSFDQPIITSVSGTNYTTREITTGNVLSLGIEPKKVF